MALSNRRGDHSFHQTGSGTPDSLQAAATSRGNVAVKTCQRVMAENLIKRCRILISGIGRRVMCCHQRLGTGNLLTVIDQSFNGCCQRG